MTKIDKENFIQVENHDFIEFVRSVVEVVSMGYTALDLSSEGYPQTFGGLVYTCKLYRTEVKGIEIPKREIGGVQTEAIKSHEIPPLLQEKQAEEATKEAQGEPEQKKAGRPKGSSKNPRYDKGLKFGTNNNSN